MTGSSMWAIALTVFAVLAVILIFVLAWRFMSAARKTNREYREVSEPSDDTN